MGYFSNMQKNTVRDRSLDLFKGFLIVQMTFAHVLAFYGNGSLPWYWVSQMVNLSTFGGFLFAFGWGAQLAWFPKEANYARPRILKASLRLHIGFLVSALLYQSLILNKYWEPSYLLDVLCFNAVPNYGQFLGSFTVATLAAAVLFGFWKNLKMGLGAILILIAILSTLIPSFHHWVPLAYVWQAEKISTFPFFQYMHYWILGILLCRYQLLKSLWLGPIAFVLSLPTLIYAMLNKHMPVEYPPSLFWVCGGLFIHWIYLKLSQWLSNTEKSEFLSEMGSKALYYLLGSNLLIFAFRGHIPHGNDMSFCAIVSALFLAFLYWFAQLAKRG